MITWRRKSEIKLPQLYSISSCYPIRSNLTCSIGFNYLIKVKKKKKKPNLNKLE